MKVSLLCSSVWLVLHPFLSGGSLALRTPAMKMLALCAENVSESTGYDWLGASAYIECTLWTHL